MAINKVEFGGQTLIDLTNDTVTPEKLMAGETAHDRSGAPIVGTAQDNKVPKTDIATVEPANTASRAYSVGELVYVNGNLYKVITAISIGSTFTVGTNIESTTVSDRIAETKKKFGTWQYIANFNSHNDTWIAPSDGFLMVRFALSQSTTSAYVYVYDITTAQYIATIPIPNTSGGMTYTLNIPVYKGESLRLVTNQSAGIAPYFMTKEA